MPNAKTPKSTSPVISSTIPIATQNSQQKKEKRLQIAYFKEVLNKSGVVLRYDDLLNCISKEQALVIRDIHKELSVHIAYPANTREFVTGFKLFISKEAYFFKSLAPCELKKPDETDSEVGTKQLSLTQILLGVSSIQQGIIEVILETAMSIVSDYDSEDIVKLRMLFNSLRYLSHINDTNALVTQILDLLDAANGPIKREILNLIPDIIPDCETEKTATHLSKLLEDNGDLTGAIVDCLNALNLSAELTNEIQQQIIALLQTTDVTKTFSILFEFLIINSKNVQDVLISSRTILNGIFESDEDDYKVLVFNHMQTMVNNKKNVYDGWLNLLSNIRLVTDFIPTDFIVLLILFTVNTSRKGIVEALIKKRILNGSLKLDLLNKLFKFIVPQILKDYLEPLLQIADFLLKYKDLVLQEFATEIYRLLFTHSLVNKIERQDIIHNLLKEVNSDRQGGTLVLNILLLLLNYDVPKLRQHSVQLMGLLEKLDCVDLKGVKKIFDILCTLTCGEGAEESMSGLGDELHMIIRKNLNSAHKFNKSCGIIAAVAMVKSIATIKSDIEESGASLEDTFTIPDMQDKNARIAATLLQTVNTHTMSTTEALGLYYDELAGMLTSCSNLNIEFLAWLYQIVTSDFQSTFVVDTVPEKINDMEVTLQYSLHTEDDVETPIIVNIAELTLNTGQNSILTLASHMRLLQLVHFQQNHGNLSTIDGLLGCGVVMPKLDDLNNYGSLQLKQVTDCIFHCINWFRELISAFVKQKSKKLRSKVLERITVIIELEALLKRCVSNVPDHMLPQSYFDQMSQNSSKRNLSPKASKSTRPKKKAKPVENTTTNLDETVLSTAGPSTQEKTATKKLKPVKNDIKFEFREIDIDVTLLLRYPLQMTSADLSFSSQVTYISVEQLMFLLEELIGKLSNRNSNLTLLIKDCVQLLPAIHKHLTATEMHLDEVLNKVDGCLDAKQLYTTEANNLKITFSLIMKVYSLIFNWKGFQNTKNHGLLRECLSTLRNVDNPSQIISSKTLLSEAAGRFLAHDSRCIYLPAAVHLIQIVQAFHTLQRDPSSTTKKRVAALGGKLLKKNWYNLKGERENGKNAQINLLILIKAYLSGANVKIISGLVNTLREEVPNLNSKEDQLAMLCSIDKPTFYLFYRCLCVSLLEAIHTEITGLTNNEHLDLWRTVVITMQGLMNIVKTQETKSNLISFLKNSVGILKVFLSSGIPILEIMLRSKPDEVVEIFKIMQTSTRFLHHLCCYSKYVKDTSLVAFVPQFRLTLESLVYRVKAALVANGCAAAFWMGNLKNKDIHGDDILSQSTLQTDESMDVEEELPPDEEVEEMNQSDNDGLSETASDIF